MIRATLALSTFLFVCGCASYTTPGGGVSVSTLGDSDIQAIMSREQAANFPANISVARVQAAGYRSHTNDSFGTGRYSVVTTRDVESDADFERLGSMTAVRGVAPINRILLPTDLDSIKALREASARLKADVLLIYTFDTSFQAGGQRIGPLDVVTLGFLRKQDVNVTTTVTAALFDVRTEYLYGLSEATAKETGRSNAWSTALAVDDLRVSTEKSAFAKLIPEIEKTWSGVISEYHPAGD
ncbi:MAG: hypothetical protein AAF610_00520 [Pseudomonadota bacterium]